MKKRVLIICFMAAILFGCIWLTGCRPNQTYPSVIEEAVRYSEDTNPYKDVAWNEIGNAVDWEEKAKNSDEIYYRFEGSYLEPYEESERIFMALNCYKDGGLHATFGRDNYYGYWTNIGRKNKTVLSFRLICYGEYDIKSGTYIDREYKVGRYDYEIVCDEIDDDYYEYCASAPVVMFGSQYRSCLIFGAHYSKVTGLTVNGGQTECVVGDSFTAKGLEIIVNHENGKSNQVDPEWYLGTQSYNCPILFGGFDSSVKGETAVTVSYKNTEVVQTYKCLVLGAKGITVDVSSCKTLYHQGDDLDTYGLIVNVIRDNDSISQAEPRRYKVYGFDGNKEGEQTLTVKYGDNEEFTAEYKIRVYGVRALEINIDYAKREYFIGDELDKIGIVVKASFKDGEVDYIDPNKVKFIGFDSSVAAESQTVTVEYMGFSQAFDVKIVAPEFKGNGFEIKFVSNKLCELKSNEKTAKLAYTVTNIGNQTICNLSIPEDVDMNLTDDEFAALHKQYLFDKSDLSISKITVYRIECYEDDSTINEVTANIADAPSGRTEQRFILLDTDKTEATLTYKYWYARMTDTFVLKYTLEDDILTFTEQVSARVGFGGVTFAKLQKKWRLNDDFTASRVEAE